MGRARLPTACMGFGFLLVLALVLAGCGAAAHTAATAPNGRITGGAAGGATGSRVANHDPSTATADSKAITTARARRRRLPVPLPAPRPVRPFAPKVAAGQGFWHAAGRRVNGHAAVYETTVVSPGGTLAAGIAWMDTRLLSARLYSGSESPGGGPYKFTAPVAPAQAQTLVAAFNGGFKMSAADGGYYTERRMIYPLRAGSASLVIYRGGAVNVGPWGSYLTMTPNVVAVRQNLVPLVAGGHPTPLAATTDWPLWGYTCGAVSCSGPGIEQQWRSAVGVTADRALVYVQGPALSPLQLARLLVRAGVVRGMELDINPDWPIFAAYRPPTAHGLASAINGYSLLPDTVRGPDTFFDAWWARDFITMSARR